MAVIEIPENTAEVVEQEAVVVPMNGEAYRRLLGQGARYGKLPVSDDSPVYVSGDPRLPS